jgi:hypothetical protein
MIQPFFKANPWEEKERKKVELGLTFLISCKLGISLAFHRYAKLLRIIWLKATYLWNSWDINMQGISEDPLSTTLIQNGKGD